MWAVLPLLALPVLLYNAAVALLVTGRLHGDAVAVMTRPILTVAMVSHGVWTVSLGDLFELAALIVLFVEFLKTSARRDLAIVSHSLSMVLLAACFVEFLIFRAFATSVFFILTVMVALDVLAGLVVTLAAARHGA